MIKHIHVKFTSRYKKRKQNKTEQKICYRPSHDCIKYITKIKKTKMREGEEVIRPGVIVPLADKWGCRLPRSAACQRRL